MERYHVYLIFALGCLIYAVLRWIWQSTSGFDMEREYFRKAMAHIKKYTRWIENLNRQKIIVIVISFGVLTLLLPVFLYFGTILLGMIAIIYIVLRLK